jgi:uncharacterized protein DUF4332
MGLQEAWRLPLLDQPRDDCLGHAGPAFAVLLQHPVGRCIQRVDRNVGVELAQRNPVELAKRMAEVGKAKKLTRRSPSEAEVARWVEQAKTLPRMLSY